MAKCDLQVVEEAEEDSEEEEEEESVFITVPISVTVLVLFIYILLGSATFRAWETTWSQVDAMYFAYITLSTIGFGDLVPGNGRYDQVTWLIENKELTIKLSTKRNVCLAPLNFYYCVCGGKCKLFFFHTLFVMCLQSSCGELQVVCLACLLYIEMF